MKGTVYRQCWCRDQETGRKLHTRCPDLKKKGHGAWYYRYDAPVAEGEKRRQPVAGPFPTRKEAEEHLAAALARVGGGGAAADRTLKVGPYLDDYLASKINLKARSRATDAEAFRLYWKPASGTCGWSTCAGGTWKRSSGRCCGSTGRCRTGRSRRR